MHRIWQSGEWTSRNSSVRHHVWACLMGCLRACCCEGLAGLTATQAMYFCSRLMRFYSIAWGVRTASGQVAFLYVCTNLCDAWERACCHLCDHRGGVTFRCSPRVLVPDLSGLLPATGSCRAPSARSPAAPRRIFSIIIPCSPRQGAHAHEGATMVFLNLGTAVCRRLD
eukprot:COSAG02_NODE_926_length_15856_cov_13.975566_10_plen_169_part_00